MASKDYKDAEQFKSELSRRRFLGAAASLAGGALLPAARAEAQSQHLRLMTRNKSSRVVQVRNRYVVNGPEIHHHLLLEMVEKALGTLTGQSTIKASWQQILDPDDIVGFKFNRAGYQVIATSNAMVDALVSSLIKAGWSKEQIVLIEAPPGAVARHGTQLMFTGYDAAETDFGSGSDALASVLQQITALIDVPFLKTHNICGLTGALKNLSHGLTKHPARFHGNGCSPYIPDIVATPTIHKKLRLCMVDALRVVYDGGPKATPDTISDEGMLLVSLDPVAVDTLGLAILNDIRSRYNLPVIARSAEGIGYLAEAHRRGLGMAVWHGIELIRVSV